MSNPYDGLTKSNETPTEDIKMGKGALWSKLNWVGILTAAVSIGTYFKGSELIADNPTAVSIVGTIVGVATVLLRLVTREPITSLK
jgi:hypothetical protein